VFDMCSADRDDADLGHPIMKRIHAGRLDVYKRESHFSCQNSRSILSNKYSTGVERLCGTSLPGYEAFNLCS